MLRSAVKLLVGVLVLPGSYACGAPTHGQVTSRDLAEQVVVEGFRPTYEYTNGSSRIVGMVGPEDIDLFAAVSAPGWEPSPPPFTMKPENDPSFEWVIWSRVRSSVNGLGCTISVNRLRAGREPPTREGLSTDEIALIADGDLAFIEVGVTCLPNLKTPQPSG
jgi:hypothetical protein